MGLTGSEEDREAKRMGKDGGKKAKLPEKGKKKHLRVRGERKKAE